MPCDGAHGRHVVRLEPSGFTLLMSYAQLGVVFFVFILTGCAGVRRRKRDGRPALPGLSHGAFDSWPNVGGSSAPLGIIWDWRPRNARERPSNRFPHEIPPSVRIAVKDGWKGVSRAFCRIVGPAGRPCMIRPRTMVGYGRGIKKQSACGHLFILATSKAPRS